MSTTLRRLAHALVAALWVTGACAQVEEYQLKAAVVYNLVKFVEWPPQSFARPSDPISVCVLGQNPFRHWLREMISGKTVDGRPVAFREVALAEANRCQILFVASSEGKRLRTILDDMRTAAVLTVGDTAGFAALGGVANLRLEGESVRIEINLGAARQKNLRISAKLLSLAEIVK